MIFQIELCDELDVGKIHPLSLGHMTIIGSKGKLTSKPEQAPERAMMIFMSINCLLDAIIELLHDRRTSAAHFTAMASSFGFFLIKHRDNVKILADKQKVIDVISWEDFITAIWQGLNQFISNYQQIFDTESDEYDIFNNLNASIAKFHVAFSEVINR